MRISTVAASVLLGLASVANAADAQAMARQSTAIPAQSLDSALRALANERGFHIVYIPEVVNSLRTQGATGLLTRDEALIQILSGTGLEFRYLDDDTVTVAPATSGAMLNERQKSHDRAGTATQRFLKLALGQSASTSPAVNSPGAESAARPDSASQDDGSQRVIETVSVFATLESALSVGSKSGQSLRETPKSITIVTGERIEAQNLSSLQDVLIQTTGVTVGAFNPLETFYYARGIRLETLQFDGGAPAYTGGLGFFYTPDTATIERVEMLRGVDGMYSGAGEPGGVINLVRKRPEATAAMRMNLSGGTWDNYRAILDGTGPLALDGRLRGRAVASYMDRGYHQDRYTTEKRILYGTLEFDATDTTLLALGLNYEKRDDAGFPGWSGMPRYSNGRPLELPREFNAAPRWAHWNLETKEAFARVEQGYGETGVLRINVNQIEQNSEQNIAMINGSVNPVTLAGSRIYGSRADYSSIQRMADVSASGKLRLFGRTHGYTVGMDYTALDGGQLSYAQPGFEFANAVLVNPFDYDPQDYPLPTAYISSYYPTREQSQRGFYATIGMQLAEPLRLTLGGRYGKFKYDEARFTIADANNPNRGMTYLRYDEQEFIPSAALSYSLSNRWTAYLSYGETFKAQGNLLQAPPPGGDPLSPIVGDNLELGIKGDVFQRVTAAASIYRLTRDGQGAADPDYPAVVTNSADGSQCCYIQQGKISVEGLDLEMSGQVLPDWQLFGGYTFTQTSYVGNPTGASVLGRTPKHQLKLWSTYQLPGRFSAVTVNGGVTAQSTAHDGIFSYGGLTLWNASVQYALTEKWTLAVYGDNLTDKIYWQPTGRLASQNIYGTPRSFTVSIRGHW